MPELPEVETVRCQLAPALEGATFVAVERVEPLMLRDCTPQLVESRLPGRRVESVGRVGKFLLVRLEEGSYLTLHLGMTGQLLLDPEGESAHTRFLFRLHDARGRRFTLEFRDIRKFGRLHLTAGHFAPRIEKLGPDAWRGAWDAAYLEQRLKGRTAPLKAFLLDQRHLAGIGNIYADEILWWAAVSPLRPGGSLTAAEVARLAEEIPRRLGEGVRLLGCSISDFVDTQGTQGGFQEWLQAYGRQGQECRRCGAQMERVVVAGRGTAYCPGCQI